MKKILIILSIFLSACSKELPITILETPIAKKDTITAKKDTIVVITPIVKVDSSKVKLETGLLSYYSFNNHLLDSGTNKINGEKVNEIKFVSDRFGNPNSAINTTNGYINLYKKRQIAYQEYFSQLRSRWHWKSGLNEMWETPLQFVRDSSFIGYGWELAKKGNYKFSISLWVKVENEEYGRILTTEAGNLETKRQFDNFTIIYGKNGNVTLQFGQELHFKIDQTKWNNIIYTYDNRNEKIYVNGNLVIQNYNKSVLPLSWTIIQYNFTEHYRVPLSLGGKHITNDNYFSGSLDEFRVYNKVLDKTDIEYIQKN